MFNGTVNFEAKIKGNGMTFPLFTYKPPNEPSVDSIDLEGPTGDLIRATIRLVNVPTQEEGTALATKALEQAVNRLTYHHGIAIEDGRITGDQFIPVSPPSGMTLVAAVGRYALVGGSASLVIGINAATLQAELQQANPAGERNFGLYRSALLSTSAVEAYMHVYNLLLMLLKDKQAKLDAFIIKEQPGVPQTLQPGTKKTETMYTRLRNELAHSRPGVNMALTKQEMANHLGDLRQLANRAIELYS